MSVSAWLVVCVAWFAAEEDNGQVLLHEGFGGSLPSCVRWVREDANEWRIREGKLEVRSQPGHIWGGNDAKNVLLFDGPIDGPAEARVSVAHQPKELWEQAGLLWYADDDNFVKLISEQIEGKMHVVIARELGGRGQVVGKLVVPASDIQLRLKVDGKQVTGQWRVTEKDAWNDAGNCPLDTEKPAHFGLFTQNGPKDPVRWVSFDDWEITKTKSAVAAPNETKK
jgi:regulation of enolase protein 1 (concanavalin A-like superfamily)